MKTIKGRPLRHYAEKAGIPWATLNWRLKHGWSLARATSTPVRKWETYDEPKHPTGGFYYTGCRCRGCSPRQMSSL